MLDHQTEESTSIKGQIPRVSVLAVGTRNIHPHGPNIYYESSLPANKKKLAATSTGFTAAGPKAIPRTTAQSSQNSSTIKIIGQE